MSEFFWKNANYFRQIWQIAYREQLDWKYEKYYSMGNRFQCQYSYQYLAMWNL